MEPQLTDTSQQQLYPFNRLLNSQVYYYMSLKMRKYTFGHVYKADLG